MLRIFVAVMIAVGMAGQAFGADAPKPSYAELQVQVAILNAEVATLQQQRDEANNRIVILSGQAAMLTARKQQNAANDQTPQAVGSAAGKSP